MPLYGRGNTERNRKQMCKKIVSDIRSDAVGKYSSNLADTANEILKEYPTDSEVPIVKIVTDAGFKIYLQELPKNLGGYIAINADLFKTFETTKIIVLNSLNDANRRRFTIAHEFGHYLFDPEAKDVAEYYNAGEDDNDTSELENLINKFAAEILMPKDKFIEKNTSLLNTTPELVDRIVELSNYFKVPPKAVNLRFSEVC